MAAIVICLAATLIAMALIAGCYLGIAGGVAIALGGELHPLARRIGVVFIAIGFVLVLAALRFAPGLVP